MQNTEIRARFDALVSLRKTQDDTMQQIERFVLPFRGEFFRDMHSEHEVMWRRRHIYDSTAVQACQTLAASIQGALTSPAIRWFDLNFQNADLNEKDSEAREWLDSVQDTTFRQLQESNFDTESSEFYLDLCGFGTGNIFEEEKKDSQDKFEELDFSSAPMRDCYFEHDHKGNVMRFYRRFQWTPLQMKDKFGDKIPAEIKQILDTAFGSSGTADIDKKYDIVFCVYERDNYQTADTTKMLAPLMRPYGYKYILHKDAELLGEEGGYYEQPAFSARWRKVNGSRNGFSPAYVVLSDILTLNELVEAMLESIGKVVDPAVLTTQRGLLSDLDLGRGGLTVVRSMDDLAPFESRARFDVADLEVDRLQSSINRAFFVDQLQLKESPAMTATEVQVRYELMQRLLGPTLGRLESDFLAPLLTRTIAILMRNGIIDTPPESVVEAQAQYDIEYTGPLPRAQKMDTANSTVNWYGLLGQMAEVDPEIMDVPDSEEIARGLARLQSVPEKFMRSRDQVKERREDRKKMAEDMAAAETAKTTGEAMQALGDGGAALGGALESVK